MSIVTLYSLNLIFCLVIQGLILMRVIWGGDRQKSQKLFGQVILAGMAFSFADLCWGQIETGGWNAPIWANVTVNLFYFILSGVITFRWLLYSAYVQKSRLYRDKRIYLLLHLPLIALTVLAVISCFNGMLFYVDEHNVYHRGQLYILQPILSYSYLTIACLTALAKAFRKEHYVQRRSYLTLASFAIYPYLSGLAQVIFPKLPILCMGMTIACVQVYLSMQIGQISTDQLTGLNNRTALIRFLDRRLKDWRENRRLYLLMMDIDYFKAVNDRYGHVEGDMALCYVADALRIVSSRCDSCAARYAGDEFILACEARSDGDVNDICAQIHEAIAEINRQKNLPYQLSLSIGWAAQLENDTSIPDLIRRADEKLYQAKKNRKTHPEQWK